MCAFGRRGKQRRGRCPWVSSSIRGSIRLRSVAAPCCRWCVTGPEALSSRCSGRRGAATAGEGEAGCNPWWGRWGGIVNPDPALTAVEVRPPCIICKSRVQSAAGCAWQASARDVPSRCPRGKVQPRGARLSLSPQELSQPPLPREGHVLPTLVQQPRALPSKSFCPTKF